MYRINPLKGSSLVFVYLALNKKVTGKKKKVFLR